MVLRWSGRDGGLQMNSLRDAVTAVRVRIECGLLTEAFMHQRVLCTKAKEKTFNKGLSGDTEKQKGQNGNGVEWVEVLVTEICCLCIWRNLVDRMLELPWNSDEEKYIHKCLLDYATEDPLRTTGSLLVVFYIQVFHVLRLGEGQDITTLTLNQDNTNPLVSTSDKQLIIFTDPSLSLKVVDQMLKLGWEGGHADNSIRLRSLDGAKTLETAHGHCAPVSCLGLSPDSNYLVTKLLYRFL